MSISIPFLKLCLRSHLSQVVRVFVRPAPWSSHGCCESLCGRVAAKGPGQTCWLGSTKEVIGLIPSTFCITSRCCNMVSCPDESAIGELEAFAIQLAVRCMMCACRFAPSPSPSPRLSHTSHTTEVCISCCSKMVLHTWIYMSSKICHVNMLAC